MWYWHMANPSPTHNIFWIHRWLRSVSYPSVRPFTKHVISMQPKFPVGEGRLDNALILCSSTNTTYKSLFKNVTHTSKALDWMSGAKNRPIHWLFSLVVWFVLKLISGLFVTLCIINLNIRLSLGWYSKLYSTNLS